MGMELWTSPITGYRRRGTRFSAIKQLFIDNVTARCIYEPLLSCPQSSMAMEAKEVLETRDFDVAGIKERKDGPVVSYVMTKDLQGGETRDYSKTIEHDLIISDSTPLAQIFSVLSNKEFVFVVYGNQITGIITKADINKPPVRIYIFGTISLLEMHINLWINHFFKNDSWKEEIPKERMGSALKSYDLRKGNNQELTLVECLQLCDKRELLLKSKDFLNKFNLSKKKFKSLVGRAETIRNELVHSQNSIIANINWTKFVNTIQVAETFLIESDLKVEESVRDGNDFQDLLI